MVDKKYIEANHVLVSTSVSESVSRLYMDGNGWQSGSLHSKVRRVGGRIYSFELLQCQI